MSAYNVVVLNESCQECGSGTEYSIEDPDGVCLGTSWIDDVDEAEYWCDTLNQAFEEGKKSHG